MIGELAPVRFDPQTAGREVWSRFHELRRLRHAEMRPDDPLEPDEIVEIRMKKPTPFELHHRYEIARDGVALSSFYAETVTPENPEYETNKHLMWAEIYVRRDQRRKGIASLWLPFIAQLMRTHGCTVVGGTADREPGHQFLTWLGAEAKLAEIESRLELARVDWDLMKRWVEEGQSRSPLTRLEIYDEPMPEAMWPEYAAQRSALLNTMPFEDLDIGTIIVTPERMREYYERMAATGEVEHEVLTREPDGVISSMTDTSWAPYRPTHIYQEFTGVSPAARGRGLGKWIKAAMAIHVHELHPEAEWIVTENAGSNAAMLGINRAMGFKAHRNMVEYQIPLDKLEAKVSAL
jgi:GNAT superfamily N-acetyltransferase